MSSEQRAEAAAWCKARADELSADILQFPGPFAQLPFEQYGAVCRQALAYAVSLGAARLIPELGAETIEGHGSIAQALRQVQLLGDWLAGDGASKSRSGEGPASAGDDPSAYVAVSELWPHRQEFKRASDVTKFLDRLPNEPAPAGIRYRRQGQRRFVHAGDWVRFFAEKDRRATEALDAEDVQDALAGVAARQAQERERKRRR
jgi:hypothetical protein